MSAMTRSFEWYLERQRSLGGAVKRLGELVAANRTLALGVVLGILVGVGGIFGYLAWGRRQEQRAADLLYNAVGQLASKSSAEQATRQEEAVRLLKDIIDRYPRTAAAAEATLRIGNLFYGQGNYDEARKAYQAYLARNPRGRVAFHAGLGVADSHLAQGQYEAAQAAYARLITDFPQHSLLPEAYLNLARTYLYMGKSREAGGTYGKVAQTYPNTGWARTAQSQLRKLSIPR